MRLYHGSPNLFDKFDRKFIGSNTELSKLGHGFYAARKKEGAEGYVKYLYVFNTCSTFRPTTETTIFRGRIEPTDEYSNASLTYSSTTATTVRTSRVITLAGGAKTATEYLMSQRAKTAVSSIKLSRNT